LISTEKMIESGINSLFIAGNIYTVKALINPAVYPTQIIYIESEINKLDGQYKVITAEYSGDTHDGDWLMKLEVEQNVSKNG